MAEPAIEPLFIDAPGRQLFALIRRPAGRSRGAVLHVPAFAEEMNKSRRMVRMASTALVELGYTVMLLDLHGCGDSSGRFEDARWQTWVDDVLEAARHLRRVDTGPLWLWGLRSGCLLSTQAAAQLDEPCNQLFWQPALSGRQVLQQFLRLRLAASIDGKAPKESLEQLRTLLASGHCVDVAGYALPPAVSSGLEASALTAPPRPARVHWIEVSSRPEGGLLPASRPIVGQWEQAGHQVATSVVAGPAFWQTVWLEDAPELLTATVSALRGEPA